MKHKFNSKQKQLFDEEDDGKLVPIDFKKGL
jgi:hypothetical protein